MTTPRIIALDLDGTLLTGDSQISERNRAAVLAAQAAGVEIVIATGRRHSYAMKVVRDLGLHPRSAMISSNGAVLRTIGTELIARHHMPPAIARWLAATVGPFRSRLVLTFDLVGPSGDDRCGALVLESYDELNRSIENWIRTNQASIRRVSPIEDALDGDAPIQMMLCGSVALMREAEELLLDHPQISAPGHAAAALRPGTEVSLHRTEYTDRDLSIIDILPAGISKASALAELLALRGWDRADVLAVGDNWNDVAMLDFAGRSVLLANAPQELQQTRRWPLGKRHDEDGVAHAIESVLAGAAA